MELKTITLNTGIEMPLVGLGTWELRGSECVSVVRQAIELGYRLIDTAQMYGNEAEVGQGIRESGIDREQLFVTTKIYGISNSFEKAKLAIDQSLNNLGLDYVDLLLLHEPDPHDAEMYRAMEEAYRAGKARAIGISNYDEKRYLSFLEHCTIVPAVNQVEAHVYYQKEAFQKIMEEHGTRMQAWAPLSQGIGRIGEEPVLKTIASAHHKTPAQIALRYLVQRHVSIIPKSRHIERLKENIDLFDFELSNAEMDPIRTLDTKKTFFPWTERY